MFWYDFLVSVTVCDTRNYPAMSKNYNFERNYYEKKRLWNKANLKTRISPMIITIFEWILKLSLKTDKKKPWIQRIRNADQSVQNIIAFLCIALNFVFFPSSIWFFVAAVEWNVVARVHSQLLASSRISDYNRHTFFSRCCMLAFCLVNIVSISSVHVLLSTSFNGIWHFGKIDDRSYTSTVASFPAHTTHTHTYTYFGEQRFKNRF